MKVKASEFIKWVESKVGSPYLWGGQGETLFDMVLKYCLSKSQSAAATEKMIVFLMKNGVIDKEFYDCSGLGVKFLMDHGALRYDTTADGLYRKCDPISDDEIRAGDWVFFIEDECAVHIGYMVTDTEVVHALDQTVGVVREKLSERKEWNAAGRPTAYIEYDLEKEKVDVKKLKVGDKITVKTELKRYNTAWDAQHDVRAMKDLYEPGVFYVYKVDDDTGAVNITKKKDEPGSWVML